MLHRSCFDNIVVAVGVVLRLGYIEFMDHYNYQSMNDSYTGHTNVVKHVHINKEVDVQATRAHCILIFIFRKGFYVSTFVSLTIVVVQIQSVYRHTFDDLELWTSPVLPTYENVSILIRRYTYLVKIIKDSIVMNKFCRCM